MRRVNWHGFFTVADRIFRRHWDRHFGFPCHGEISVELLDAQVPEVFISEEVLLGERQVVLWIWVVRHSRDVPRVAQIPILFLTDEARRRVLTRLGASDHMEIQQTIEAHAYSDCPAFQPILQTVLFRLHEVPFLWFAGVFRRVGSRVVCAMQGIKWHGIHARRREHGKVDVVWDHKLIVFGQASLQRHSFRILAVALAGVYFIVYVPDITILFNVSKQVFYKKRTW
jgi:hypothetical protein